MDGYYIGNSDEPTETYVTYKEKKNSGCYQRSYLNSAVQMKVVISKQVPTTVKGKLICLCQVLLRQQMNNICKKHPKHKIS